MLLPRRPVRIIAPEPPVRVQGDGAPIEIRRPKATDNPKVLADFKRVLEQTDIVVTPEPPCLPPSGRG